MGADTVRHLRKIRAAMRMKYSEKKELLRKRKQETFRKKGIICKNRDKPGKQE